MNINEIKAVVTTTGMQIASSFSMLAIAAVAPVIAKDFGIASSLIGSYTGILYIGSAIAATMCSGFLARLGAIRLSQIALFLSAVSLLLDCSPFVVFLALGGFVNGLGYGVMTPCSSDLLSRYVSPKHLGFVFSLKQSGVPLGFALAGCTLPWISTQFGWRAALIFVAATCIVISLLATPMHRELDTVSNPKAKLGAATVLSSIKLVLHNKGLRQLALLDFAYCGMQLCILSFLVSFLVESRGYDIIVAGTLLSCVNLGGMFGRPFWGWFSDLVQKPRIVIGMLGLVAAVIVYLLTIFDSTTPLVLVMVCAVLLGSTAIGWNGVSLALMVQFAPKGEAGAATGGSLFFSFSGSMGFPLLFSFIERVSGSYETCFLLMAAVSGIISVWWMLSSEK